MKQLQNFAVMIKNEIQVGCISEIPRTKSVHLQQILLKRNEPIKGGICIGSKKFNTVLKGTLGITFKKKKRDEKIFFISNAHLFKRKKSQERVLRFFMCGDQPTVIGYLSDDINLNKIDAAIVEIHNAFSKSVSPGILDHKNVKFVNSKIKEAKNEDQVSKYGGASKKTSDKIISISEDVTLESGSNKYKYSDCFAVQSTMLDIAKGDSGSILLDRNNNILGLIFSYNKSEIKINKKTYSPNSVYFAFKMDQVLKDLGIQGKFELNW